VKNRHGERMTYEGGLVPDSGDFRPWPPRRVHAACQNASTR
jgi:hypothetical protein